MVELGCPWCGKMLNLNLSKSKHIFFNNPKIVKENKPKSLTDVQKVVEIYKTVKGIEENDEDWDRVYFARHAKDAKDLLVLLKNNIENCGQCILEISEKMKKKGLEWNLNTVAKQAPDWFIDGNANEK